MNIPVLFHYTDSFFKLRSTKLLKESVKQVFDQEQVILERIDYILCSDTYLLEININYLGHQDLTDIITFDLSDDRKGVVGEVYISAERVFENAKKYAVTYQHELKRVILHGALHLCGYKDKTRTDKDQMRQKEHYYLNL